MTDLNRNIAPKRYPLSQVHLLTPEKHTLSNGLDIHVLNGGNEELIKFEILYHTGNRYDTKPLLSQAVNHLMNAGTNSRTSFEIMEQIDFYGAFYQHENQHDRSSYAVYTLNKYADEVLEIFADLILNPTFPTKEIDLFIQNAKQRFQINLKKNDFLARRAFNNALFPNHPYGIEAKAEDYDQLTQDDLLNYYAKHMHLSNATIMLTGKVEDKTLKTIDKLFGSQKIKQNDQDVPPSIGHYDIVNKYTEKPDALQSAIRIGKRTINKRHPDYIPLSILMTVLGGYFGSRLMSNIREDKGYTYGISAGLMSVQETGIMYIGTEVGVDVCADALKEIYKEISILSKELIPQEELELVKNFLKGSYIGGIENIFSHNDKFKSVHFYQLDNRYYDAYFNALNTVNSEQLLLLAKEYLQPESFLEVVIGKK